MSLTLSSRRAGWTGGLRYGPFSLSLSIPAFPLRSLRRTRQTRAQDSPQRWSGLDLGRPGRLLVVDPPPSPALQVRDAARALNFFRPPGGDPPPAAAVDPLSVDVGDPQALAAAVSSMSWYHSIELPSGVVTPGQWDHRPLVPHYGLPEDLTGLRVLDVATYDGFWAFEMERRGAEVWAIDLDRVSRVDLPDPARARLELEQVDAPMGMGFTLAARALGSGVHKVVTSVYDLDPDTHGRFDLVHVGDLLLHLRSPVQALAAVRAVTRGRLLVSDVFDPSLPSGRRLVEYRGGWDDLVWWQPSLEALGQMVVDAGFSEVEVHRTYNLAQRNSSFGLWRAVLRAR